jgi:hypothetical protein
MHTLTALDGLILLGPVVFAFILFFIGNALWGNNHDNA